MKICLFITFFSSFCFQNLLASVGTYTFVNKRNSNTTVNFSYPGRFPENGTYQLVLSPNGQYSMTFDSGTSGTASIAPGNGKFENLQGSLVMGDAQFASNPGVYNIVHENPPEGGRTTGSGGNYLMVGQSLHAGQSLRSSDGHYELKMQDDGNLVIYHDGGAIWATATNETCKHPLFRYNTCGDLEAIMQGDGNFVIYATRGMGRGALWATGTDSGNNIASYLILLNNGKIQLHRGAGPALDQGAIWQN
jgi:hypothetical protein